jgi:2-polyprenyl-3-methyl-5-hydroxy-6-metoxy-1,4-benzoquinol methylase
MFNEKTGLSSETEYRGPVISRYFPLNHDINDKNVGEAWDIAANIWWGGYDEFGDTNRRYIIDPTILRILGQVEGKLVLDAGCGNGYLCRRLSQKGARMVGIDVSKEAIRMARSAESDAPLNIQYYVGSLGDLSMFSNNTFDLIVSNIVLCDLPDVNQALAEIHRVLNKSGKLVFSIMHPCFSSPPIHGWVRRPRDSDRSEDWLYWKVDRYFERGIEEWQFGDLPPLYGFHRPLSDYVQSLIRNGFLITDFEEPIPLKKDVEQHYRQLNDGERIPWFLVIGAVKS